ncbi:MAG: c-type cytochrome [Chitinophagaceae bacterium]
MKKITFILATTVLLAACGGGSDKKEGGETKTEGTKTETTADNDLSSNPVYQKGIELISKSDCLTCHKIEEKLTGPAYRDVANKYAGMPDTIVTHLAHKIIQGGTGVWGEVMMTPHASLSQEDAEAIVKYILLLKK